MIFFQTFCSRMSSQKVLDKVLEDILERFSKDSRNDVENISKCLRSSLEMISKCSWNVILLFLKESEIFVKYFRKVFKKYLKLFWNYFEMISKSLPSVLNLFSAKYHNISKIKKSASTKIRKYLLQTYLHIDILLQIRLYSSCYVIHAYTTCLLFK